MKRVALVLMTVLVALPLLAADPDGAALYKSKCAMCHGADGAGQTPMGKTLKLKDLRSADVQKLTDAEITKLIVDGKGKMPPNKGKLTDADVKAVVAFIRTLKK